MIITGAEGILIAVLVSCSGYIWGRFDKRLTRLEETISKILLMEQERERRK